jgi:hypothetical protein
MWLFLLRLGIFKHSNQPKQWNETVFLVFRLYRNKNSFCSNNLSRSLNLNTQLKAHTGKVAYYGNRSRHTAHISIPTIPFAMHSPALALSLAVSDTRMCSFCPAANFKCSLGARSSRWLYSGSAFAACVVCTSKTHTHTHERERERERRPLSVKHSLMDTKCDVCVHLFDAETPYLSDVRRLYPWSAPSPLGADENLLRHIFLCAEEAKHATILCWWSFHTPLSFC